MAQEALRESEAAARLQRDLIIALGSAQGVTEALDLILDAALRIQPFTAGVIYLVDQATGELNIASHRGVSEEFLSQNAHYDGGSLQAKFCRHWRRGFRSSDGKQNGIRSGCGGALGFLRDSDRSRGVAPSRRSAAPPTSRDPSAPKPAKRWSLSPRTRPPHWRASTPPKRWLRCARTCSRSSTRWMTSSSWETGRAGSSIPMRRFAALAIPRKTRGR